MCFDLFVISLRNDPQCNRLSGLGRDGTAGKDSHNENRRKNHKGAHPIEYQHKDPLTAPWA
jgi:hypothetical protein